MTQMSLREVARQRWRVAVALSALMVFIYFGFILLLAFNKEGVSAEIVPGLSVGILLGALVIVATWGVTWFYVRWANSHIDTQVAGIEMTAP